MASRSRRSVTASAQALDHSLPGKPERSLPPLGLLFPTRTASLGSARGPERGAPPASGGRGGCPHPPAGRRRVQENAAAGRRGRAATRAAPTARVEDSCRGPMRAEGELPRRGKRGCPGTSAPTKKGAANRRIAAGTALKMKVKYKYIARLFDKSLRASACSPPRPLPPLTAHRSTVPIHP